MPLQALACTQCGSADVQALKADTYFCNHCETVFKHVDPSRVTAQPEFCECGGAIAFECRICHSKICRGHDAWGQYPKTSPKGYESAERWEGNWIPTPVPAYRLADAHSTSAAGALDGYFVRSHWGNNIQLIQERLGYDGERHLCHDCLRDTFAEVTSGHYDTYAEKKVAGELCALPDCMRPAGVVCECCGLSWCALSHEGYELGHAPYRSNRCNECGTEREQFREAFVSSHGFTSALSEELGRLTAFSGLGKREQERLGKRATKRRVAELQRMRALVSEEAHRAVSSKQCDRRSALGVEIKGYWPEGVPAAINKSRVFAAWVRGDIQEYGHRV